MSMENGIISGFSVSDKASSIHQQQQNSSGIGLGLMLQSTESIIPADNSNMSMNPMMMMVIHNHHRPFSSSYERNGPTCSSDIYDVASAAAANCCGGAVVRTLQPFDIFSAAAPAASAPTAALKSPGGMAASLGFFPFTNAQKKELERQAMIYKYMMASVPVPPDLLFPITRNPHDPASHSNLGKGSVFNLRYTNNTDSEPGRCRRTDGKKWRCSRDVAPDRKYCERHMHRGRPRSRKPVELHSHFNNKTHLHNDPPSTPKINSTAAFSTHQYLGSTSRPYDRSQTPVFVCKSEEKVSPFESVVSASSYKEPRSLEWMMKQEAVPMATSDQEWHHLMRTKIGLTTETSFCDTYASVFQQPCKEEPLNLNSYTHFNGGEDQQNNEMVFIDAWSNAVTEDNNVHSSNKNSVSSSSSNGELSLSSLALSMAGHNTMNEEMGQIQMGLGIIQSDRNHHGSSISNVNKPQISTWLTQSPWVGPTPGGPLAEVLRPSTVTAGAGAGTASNPASPIPGNGDSGTSQATTVSSPSGVLQKTLAAMSDSSCGSSPTLVASTVKPEIAVQWLNQGNLGSYSSSWV